MNMFEKATRQKLRFASPMGSLTVEDVWGLPLQHRSRFDLDDLAKNLHREIKQNEEESFVAEPSTQATSLTLKMDIVKHIITVRLREKESAEKAQETRARNEKIMAILERKQDQELEGKSVEELQQLLNP